jgi:CheY-like chemotaxis protein
VIPSCPVAAPSRGGSLQSATSADVCRAMSARQSLSELSLDRASLMLRVLVVDDDRDTAETMCALLEMQSYAVFIAFDGTTAVQAAEALHPDVVLLDLALGSVPDGYEVARQIRRQAGKQPVIVCISGYGRDVDRRESRNAGFDLHLLKPVNLADLEQLLGAIRDGVALADQGRAGAAQGALPGRSGAAPSTVGPAL